LAGIRHWGKSEPDGQARAGMDEPSTMTNYQAPDKDG